jgi:single-stranded DNA-specific DHH superfamily exonuclease
MELLKKYKKPILVLRPKAEDGKLYYMGSGRAKPNKDFTSFQGFLKESGICEFVEGHDNAFGCSIEAVKLSSLITYANDHLSHIEFLTDDYEVDYIFDSVAKISSKMLSEFGSAINIYGNGIPQPKFAFEISIFPYQIQLIGGDQTTVKFSINGVDFIKFKDKELATLIRESYCDMFKFRLIGRAQINEWYEKITPQIIIDEIEVEETKIEKLF